jgi:hypothetical protein
LIELTSVKKWSNVNLENSLPLFPEIFKMGFMGAFIVARSYEINEGIRRFQCINPKCGNETVIDVKKAWLPPGCLVCGDKFDWGGIFTQTGKESYIITPITTNLILLVE